MGGEATTKEPEDMRSVWSVAARWLFGQEANTVMLFMLVGGSFYVVRHLVPVHLESIQLGYERIEVNHAAQAKDQRDSFATIVTQQNKTLEFQAQTYEKSLSRIADSFDKTMERALHKVEGQP